MGGCSASLIGIFLFLMGLYFIHKAKINHRDAELHGYLNSIKDWNEVYSEQFGAVDISVRGQEDEFPMTKSAVQTMSDIDLRLAMKLAFRMQQRIVEKPLKDK